jgi:hypothetical protein
MIFSAWGGTSVTSAPSPAAAASTNSARSAMAPVMSTTTATMMLGPQHRLGEMPQDGGEGQEGLGGRGRPGGVRRGELYIAAARGAYAGEPRPVVIVQDDRFDATASITVCPLTTSPLDARCCGSRSSRRRSTVWRNRPG